MNFRQRKLLENLEHGDLKRLIKNEISIDEFKSKMGDDADICVVAFEVKGKEPSADLVSFIEKGYTWVLDADVSSGEKDAGNYLVFIEIERTKELPDQVMQIINDLANLTEFKPHEWSFRYYKSHKLLDVSIDTIARTVPLTPEKYNAKYSTNDDNNSDAELDQLKAAAGVTVDTKAPVNDFTESLRVAAGIK